MDKGQRQSRRAIRGNLVFVALAVVALALIKALVPAVPVWVVIAGLLLSCFGLLGDLINILRKPSA